MKLRASLGPVLGLLLVTAATPCWADYPAFSYADIASGGDGGRVAIGDIDGDALNDVVVHEWGSSRGTVADGALVWYQYPDWTPTTIASGKHFFGDGVVIIDIDDDGDNDVFAPKGSDNIAEVWWYENPGVGGGTWTEHEIGLCGNGSEVKDIDVVDVDQDGKLDVVTRQRTYVVFWFLDDAAANAWTKRTVNIVEHEGMAVGDVDNDGDDDVVCNGYWLANPELPAGDARTDAWTRYDIDGLWFAEPQDAWWKNSVKAVVADVNGDGANDVVFSHSESYVDGFPIAWYESDDPTGGTAAWTRHDIVSSIRHQHTLQAGDFDNDGDTDIIAGRLKEAATLPLVVYYNGGGLNPTWTPVEIDDTGCYSGQVGDIGGDGDLDFVSSREWDSGPVYIMENQLDPFVAELGFEQATIDASDVAYERVVGDIDRDGRNDILATPHEPIGELWLYRAPDFSKEIVLTLSGGTHGWPYFRADDVQLADFDRDGDLDVAARIGDGGDANGQVVWIENPLVACHDVGGAWTVHAIGANAYVKDIVVADFDGDGWTDIATRCASATQVWLNNAAASWTKREIVHPGHEGLDVGDLDGDDDPDLVLNGFWLETPADPRVDAFAQHEIDDKWHTQSVGWESNSCKVALADIDADGALDVVLSHSEYTGYPVSWYSTADPVNGPWTEHVIVPVCDDCHNLHAKDFDDDGHVDVLYGGMPQSAQRGLHLMLGDGGSTWTPFEIQSDGSYSAELGDIDDDGDADIVGIRNWNGAPTEIWRNTLYAPAGPIALDQWQYVEVDDSRDRFGDTSGPSWLAYFGLGWGDLTGDGYLDIVSGRYFYRNPGGDMTGAWPRVDLTAGNSLSVIDASLALDVDGDEFGDVIGFFGFHPDGSHVYWLEADDADGTSWSAYLIDDSAPYEAGHLNPQGYAVADLIAGGRPEVILSNGEKIYYYEIPAANPEAGAWPRTEVLDQSVSEDIGVADVDNDGLLDIAAAHYAGSGAKSLKWARNPGDGSANWAEYIVGEVVPSGGGQWPDRVKAADVNGDGRADLLVSEEITSSPASTYWFEAPADPTQVPWTRHLIVTQSTTNNMDVADMDLDGDIDVVLQEHRGDEVLAIWENDGCGNFAEHVIDTYKEGHLGARVADLDQDGDNEIFSIAFDSYQYLHLWRNDNGSGVGPVNRPPVAYDDSFDVEPGDSYSGGVSATDPDALDTLTFEVVDGPVAGVLSSFDANTGAFTYDAPATDATDSFTFSAFDGQTYSNTATVSINIADINDPPTASFTAGPNTVGEAPLTVNFDASASSDPDGTIVSYAWNWGDETPDGSGATPAHTFNNPGLYTVTLTVADDGGATGEATGEVHVYLDAEGLIGYWTFEEDAGATSADLSGFGNDVTLHGGAGWADGKYGTGLALNGTSAYAARADADLSGAYPAISTGVGEDFTVAAWVYLNRLGHRHPLVQKQGDETRGFNFTVEPDDKLTIELFESPALETEIATATALAADVWTHVALTYDYVASGSSVVRLYVDGVEGASSTSAYGPIMGNAVELNFGRYYWASSYQRYLDGRLDEVRVYDRALSTPEIAALAADQPSYQLGDLNCDGAVNSRDIDAFVLAMVNPDDYLAAHPGCDVALADCNGDQQINSRDIDAFVSLIVGE